MKRLLLLAFVLVPAPTWACDHRTALYGAALTVDFSLYQTTGTDLKTDAAHASGDTKVMKDEGAEANTTNGFTDRGQGYSIALTASEMTAARVVLYVVDQGTKAWIDHCVVIDTYGSSSAQHAVPEVSLSTAAGAELSACPTATASQKDQLQFLFMQGRNKYAQTSSTGTLYKDNESSALCTFSTSDNGTTYTTGEGS